MPNNERQPAHWSSAQPPKARGMSLPPPPAIPGRGTKAEAEGKRPREATNSYAGDDAPPKAKNVSPKDADWSDKHEEAIHAIARKHLDMNTLNARGSDSHDFKEHAVWAVREALKAAFQAGKNHK